MLSYELLLSSHVEYVIFIFYRTHYTKVAFMLAENNGLFGKKKPIFYSKVKLFSQICTLYGLHYITCNFHLTSSNENG